MWRSIYVTGHELQVDDWGAMFLIQFTFPRISVLINSRKNYFKSLTQNSILHRFIWLQINLPEDKHFNQLPLQIWNKWRGTGIGSLLKVGPDYPPFLEAIVIPSRGFTKISGRILRHMLWDGIKVGFKKTKFFSGKAICLRCCHARAGLNCTSLRNLPKPVSVQLHQLPWPLVLKSYPSLTSN